MPPQTPFYHPQGTPNGAGERLVGRILEENSPLGLTADRLAVSFVVYDGRHAAGFAHNGDQPFYPCSVVKMFWMAACLDRLRAGAVEPHPELDRALHDMIKWSSNMATNYVIDLVTGTTGDTLLEGPEFEQWRDRRSWANRWLRSLGWPEIEPINVCQKNMDDDRYGRERQLVDALGHNSLTVNATARLLHEIFDGSTFPEPDRIRMRDLLARPHDPAWVEAHPLGQVRGYFGAGLPEDAKLWSKAGWTGWTGDRRASYRRHDAARIEAPGLPPFTLVVFTEGRAMSESEAVLPKSAAAAVELLRAAV
jgi:beta-lactamase class A